MAEEVGYRECSDALENLVALGLRKDEGFSSSEADQIRVIAAIVQMEDSPFLQKLQAKAERETADLAAAK